MSKVQRYDMRVDNPSIDDAHGAWVLHTDYERDVGELVEALVRITRMPSEFTDGIAREALSKFRGDV